MSRLPERATLRLPFTDRRAKPPETPASGEERLRLRIRDHLEARGYTLVRERAKSGPTLEAQGGGGETLWVYVRSEPQGGAAARREFADALLDLVLARAAQPHVTLALALPRESATYRELSRGLGAVKTLLGFRILWVDARGGVTLE